MEPDASDVAVGAIFLQQYDDGLYPVAYFSKKYIPSKRNYAHRDKELLKIFKSFQKWRYYLDRHQTTVFTNHKVLVNLKRSPTCQKDRPGG